MRVPARPPASPPSSSQSPRVHKGKRGRRKGSKTKPRSCSGWGEPPALGFLLALSFQALLTSPGPEPPHPAPAVLTAPQQALQFLRRWSLTARMRRRGPWGLRGQAGFQAGPSPMGFRGQVHVSGPEVPWPDRMSPPRSPHLTMQSQSKRQSLPVPGPLPSRGAGAWVAVPKGGRAGTGASCAGFFFFLNHNGCVPHHFIFVTYISPSYFVKTPPPRSPPPPPKIDLAS